MNRFLVFLFLFISPLALFAQQRYGGHSLKNANTYSPYSQSDTENKLGVRFSSGFMFASLGDKNFFSSYISPELSYKFTDNFNLSVGLVLNNQPNLYFDRSFANDNFMMNNANNFLVYYRGEYYVNDNFRISSMGVFDLGNNFANDRLSQANFALDYKFDSGFAIRAEVNYINLKYYNPYTSPYGVYNSFYSDTFYHSPFGVSLDNDPFRTW